MSVWAKRRQLTYLFFLVIIIALISIWIYFSFFKSQETCFDGIKNQTELNIDCGGGCQAVCTEEAVEPVVLWTRTFKIDSDSYSVAAAIENPNLFGVEKIEYKFRLEDEFGRFITERVGETYMNPDQRFVIFETNIPVGKREPLRASFEIVSRTPWYRYTDEDKEVPIPTFNFSDKSLEKEDGGVKVVAVIKNTSVIEAKNIEVIAVVFNEKNNAIASSKTIVESLLSEGETRLTFTWPEDFSGEAKFFELFPRVYSVKLAD